MQNAKVIFIPLSGMRYAVVESDPIREGDQILLLAVKNGDDPIGVKSQKISEGDQVVVVTTNTGNWALRCKEVVKETPAGAIVAITPNEAILK